MMFNADVSPAEGSSFPLTMTVQATVNGTPAAGASSSATFTEGGRTGHLSFAVPVEITAVPATISVATATTGQTMENGTFALNSIYLN